MSRPIRLGVVGLGLIAQAVHLPNLRGLRHRFEVVHLCDLSATLAERLATQWGGDPAWSADPDEVFANPEVEAVLLLTPGTHGELTRRALAAGKHVLAEKPFTHTAGGAELLATEAAAHDRVLQVGYMKMYDPAVARARRALEELGEIRLVRVTVLHPADEPQFSHVALAPGPDPDLELAAQSARADAAQLGEAVGDLAEPFRSVFRDVLQGSVCHELSVLRALFGDEAIVRFGTAAAGGLDEVGTTPAQPPTLQAIGEIGEAQLLLSWNWLPEHPEYFEEVAVFGSAGRMRLQFPGPYALQARARVEVDTADGDERRTSSYVRDPRTGFEAELDAFHAAVRDGADVVSTATGAGLDASRLQELIVRLSESAGAEPSVGGEAAAFRPKRSVDA